MPKFQEVFVSNAFKARIVTEPSVDEWRCYPGAIYGGRVDGLSVQFTLPCGEEWFGSFASGILSPTSVDYAGVVPGGRTALIVSKGEGYLVEPQQPETWQSLSIRPIKGVLAVPGPDVIVLWDFQRFLCIDRNGIRWRTGPVSWDGISEVMYRENMVKGTVWDASEGSFCAVEVAVSDGSIVGGPAVLPGRS